MVSQLNIGTAPEDGAEKPSLKSQLLAQVKTFGSAKQLQQSLREAKEAGATPEIVNLFAELVRRGDEIGVQRFCFTRPPEEARKEWLSLPWEDWEKNLSLWAEKGDMGAKEIIDTLNVFAQNTLLRDLLREVVTQFERLCRPVNTYGGLITYLEALVEKQLVQRINYPRNIPEQGVAIERGAGETHLYLPRINIEVSRLGWPFVKAAEARAKNYALKQRTRLEAIKAEATPGLTLTNVSAGKEGNFFLALGPNRGVLIEIQREGNRMIARVVKAVGVWVSPIPSARILWSPETNHVPLRGNQWPSEEIPKALQRQEERILLGNPTAR